VRAELGIAPEQTAVLYAPTHRDFRRRYEPELDLAALADTLGPQFVLMVRAHYFYVDDPLLRGLLARDSVVDVSTYPRIEDLCLASDILWATATARLLPRLLTGRATGPVFLADRRSPATGNRARALSDVDPATGRGRLSYPRAEYLFKQASKRHDPHGVGWTLR